MKSLSLRLVVNKRAKHSQAWNGCDGKVFTNFWPVSVHVQCLHVLKKKILMSFGCCLALGNRYDKNSCAYVLFYVFYTINILLLGLHLAIDSGAAVVGHARSSERCCMCGRSPGNRLPLSTLLPPHPGGILCSCAGVHLVRGLLLLLLTALAPGLCRHHLLFSSFLYSGGLGSQTCTYSWQQAAQGEWDRKNEERLKKLLLFISICLGLVCITWNSIFVLKPGTNVCQIKQISK